MTNIQPKYCIDDIYNKINKTLTEDIHSIPHETKKILEKCFNEGEQGQLILLNILILRRLTNEHELIILDGLLFDYLMKSNINNIKEKLYYSFPNGIVPLKSSLKMNYEILQKLLIEKNFKEADKLTQKYLCSLAGLNENNKRQWLYFTDISLIPAEDLYTIDLLWQMYSQGKFGFSIQRKIWIFNNYNWNKLWQQIGWIHKGVMRRYPQEFIWTINAPTGHLPLFNQLRGNQVLASLFEHIAWKNNKKS
uniref:GUN4-like domain-containing protein n=1 Tax=Pleonosporium borreri TaxID=2575635 RepID=A0A4D6X1R8_9FLOR|nr:hypothetical protein [Pleonosporium borreri]